MDNNGHEDNTPKYLAIGITFMVGLIGFALFYFPIPKGNEQLIIQLVTGILAAWGVAIGFYYQTTKNQSKAQDTMNRQARLASDALAASAPGAAPATGAVELKPGEEVEVRAKDEAP